jgi:outer membrane lipoprotein SlyB
MNKMLFAAMLTTIVGLTGCASTAETATDEVVAADAAQREARRELIQTGSRIPTGRTAMVSSTEGAEARKQMNDGAKPFKMSQ